MKEHLKREAFIWEVILHQVRKSAIPNVKNLWKKDREVPTMMLSWPAEYLPTDSGEVVTHLVSFAPPKGEDLFKHAVNFARDTKAYALLLVEEHKDKVQVIVESAHGARSWNFPKKRHGDVLVLGKESATKDDECIGILWRRSMNVN